MSGRVKVSESVLLIFAVALLFDTTELTMIFILSAFIHELGHLIAILLCKGKIISIKLTVFGGIINYHQQGGKLKDIIICASGAIFGLITAYISSKLGYFTFSGANLILSIVNIIPVLPLDGGRIAEQILPYKAVNILGFIMKIIITISGIIITIYGKGCSLLMFSFVLWGATSKNSIEKHIKIR